MPSERGVTRVGFDLRNHDDQIAFFRDMAIGAADNAENLGSTLLCKLHARIRLTLTLRSASPPPTEKTKIASLLEMRLTSSQPVKTVSHPSSFVRAVNSETLSTGA